jgi:hypothetical protein
MSSDPTPPIGTGAIPPLGISTIPPSGISTIPPSGISTIPPLRGARGVFSRNITITLPPLNEGIKTDPQESIEIVKKTTLWGTRTPPRPSTDRYCS